ncbi:unnamed protein product, partial [Protopolystoma xenopodis]
MGTNPADCFAWYRSARIRFLWSSDEPVKSKRCHSRNYFTLFTVPFLLITRFLPSLFRPPTPPSHNQSNDASFITKSHQLHENNEYYRIPK